MIGSKILQLPSRILSISTKAQVIQPRFPLHQAYLRSFSTSLPKMSTNNDDFQLSNLFNVKDKVALVTGGGSGIGLMVSKKNHMNSMTY